MFNIKTTKKYFIAISLFAFFNTSAFATNITDIGNKINQFLASATDLAYVEYKTKTKYSNEQLKEIVDFEVNSLLGFLRKSDLTINNIDVFFKEFVNVANNIRSRIKSDCSAGIYKNKNSQLDINGSVASSSKSLSISLLAVCTGLHDFITDNLVYTKDSYKDFTKELTNENLLDSEKQSLFNSLKALSRTKILRKT